MNTANLIILDSEEKVIFIGNNVLSFLSTRKNVPLGWTRGNIEMGDLFLYYASDAEKKKDEIADILNVCASKKNIKECKGLIMVFCADRNDLLPIIKLFPSENVENGVLLDTIYESNKIRVLKSGKEIKVTLNRQTVSFPEDTLESLYLLAKDNTIHSLGYADQRHDSDLHILLNEKRFGPWVNKSAVYNHKAGEVLNDEVYRIVHEFRSNDNQQDRFLNMGAKTYRVTSTTVDLPEETIQVISICDSETIMKDLSDSSAAYKRITRNSQQDAISGENFNAFSLLGDDDHMKEVTRLLQKSSVTNTTILLTGESGTGKTFIAGQIHKASRRSSGPFINVNCAAIPYQLMESELFGYEEGAFTGAKKGGKKGYFEMAYGGTLFLDEIGEIPLQLQGKLLEVLQSKTFYHVGGTRQIKSDVRVIAATNKNLKDMVKEKRFREDLFYRINVFPIDIPPLRERRSVLYSIVMDILPDVCSRLGIEPLVLSSQAYKKIQQYPWPGNIRELENTLEKAAILSDGKIILADDILLSDNFNTFSAVPVTLQEVRENAEREAIVNALRLYQGDKIKAAQYLNIGRTNIFDKIKKYNIRTDEVI